jgi:hypothetical protein
MLEALVNGISSPPAKGIKGSCPFCGEIMIPKCGDSDRIHHWAHKIKNCDDWQTGKETDWHLNWKQIIGKGLSEKQIIKNNEIHRADILIPGNSNLKNLIFEFQNSHLSQSEIKKREVFYGEGLIWVINGTQLGENFSIDRHYLDKYFFNWHFTPSYDLNFEEYNPHFSENGAYIIEIPETKLNMDYVLFIKNEGFFNFYIAYLPVDKSFYRSDQRTCKHRVYYKSFENDEFDHNNWLKYFNDFNRRSEQEYQKYISKKHSFSCSYNWKRSKRDFNIAECPVFIDLNEDELFQIEKGNMDGGKGHLIKKDHFLARIKERIDLI